MFIADLADKAQFVTILFAADKNVSKWMVFGATPAAVIFATAVGVLVGSFLFAYIDEKVLSYIAGCGFIIIGTQTLYPS